MATRNVLPKLNMVIQNQIYISSELIKLTAIEKKKNLLCIVWLNRNAMKSLIPRLNHPEGIGTRKQTQLIFSHVHPHEHSHHRVMGTNWDEVKSHSVQTD